MIIIVMGVAGSGKTTIGNLLADALECEYLEGDSLHPAANVDAMRDGLPLTDADRAPWLAAIHDRLVEAHEQNRSLVVGCSALKASYRRTLAAGVPITWVYLTGTVALIRQRLRGRAGHFFDDALVDSQFDILEEPDHAIVVDVSPGPRAIVDQILAKLGDRAAGSTGSSPARSGRWFHAGASMELGLIGLGRMGAGLAGRLIDQGHAIVGHDLSADDVAGLVRRGGMGARSLEDLVARLRPPRMIWVMVPHGGPTHDTIERLLSLLTAGDLVVDGGNSNYKESMAHAARCTDHDIDFLDVGVSGGIWGEKEGFNLMIGGPREAFDRAEPIFAALAPPGGYAHIGASGAGHFVKMIHNAIEYGMLQALGEGFECLHRSAFDLDLGQIAGLWQNGAVVRSWLLELLGRALTAEGNALHDIAGYIDDSGTGRWALEFAIEQGVPVPVMSTALFERFDSRTEERFAHQVIAALRSQFGGHAVRKVDS